MAETDAYCLSPISVVFDVAGLFAVWSGDGSWGPSIGCSFGLFNNGVVVGVPIDNVEWCRSVTSRGVFLNVPSGRRKVPAVCRSALVQGNGAGSVHGDRWYSVLTNSDREQRG